MLTSCKHPNLLTFIGFCDEDFEMILVFECDFKETLYDYLRSTSNNSSLTMEKQMRICLDIAHGLKHLHNIEGKPSMRHHVIHSENVFLDEKWTAKISNFRTWLPSAIEPPKTRQRVIDDIYSYGVQKLEHLKIPFKDIKAATESFDIKYRIGSGGYGEVYKAKLKIKCKDEHHDMANTVAIKRIKSRNDGQENEGFLVELDVVSKCKHPNIVSLLGFCVEDGEMLLVYELVSKGSLDEYLSSVDRMVNFTWKKRLQLCIDIAQGLKHMHTTMEAKNGIIHRDIKSANILLGVSTINTQTLAGTDFYLDPEYARTERGFLEEFEVLFKYKHENIIGLVGYCNKMDEKIILYEHASKGSLDRYLDDISFSWTKRLKICIDIANGLKFLHGGHLGQDVVIHRDIKSSNILLDKDCKAKICGFECALVYPSNQEKENVYVMDNVKGSSGYMDPLYEEIHILTKESDIYSLGVVLIEILCGRLGLPEELRSSHYVSYVLFEGRSTEEATKKIVFKGIKEQIGRKSFTIFRRIAFQCLLHDRKERPTASDVVVHLQKALEFQKAYEIRKATMHRNKEEILSNSRENHSTMAKKDIYNILSKGILLEDDKREIMQVLKGTLDLEQLIQEEEDSYHSYHTQR
ncbi:hypothetical protein M8C21_017297 [Ambrosia artemisiifolia]|uniref:Protein kinase domain-containing protein n=1 Tax=Ambrosia artemisiifolia TaxID=4212 RepID=A0AAD5GC38_AMBAR|nr:hypothetical protein M8C21_017297 [Ambrosia artemisiifolia]